MKTIKSLEELANLLNEKYSLIKDFKVLSYNDGTIRGGFYEMNYLGRPEGKYFFHETFIKLTDEINTFDKLFDYANDIIQSQLKWQKNQDESYATEFNKPLKYQFDYSLIENE